MGYRLNRLDKPIFMAVSKPLLTEFGIHHRLESCVQSIVKNQKEQNYVSDRTWSFPDNITTRDISKLHTGLDKNIKIVRRDEEKK